MIDRLCRYSPVLVARLANPEDCDKDGQIEACILTLRSCAPAFDVYEIK